MTDPHAALDDAIRAYNHNTDPGTVITAWTLNIATTIPHGEDGTAIGFTYSDGLPAYAALGLTETALLYLRREIETGLREDDE